MVRREQYRDAKGLMQRVEAMIRATLPRQAWVTRTGSTKVYVRFNGETGADPESEFISTVAGVPVGTMGWVIRLAGKKGLFVATGVPRVEPVYHLEEASFSFATSGIHPIGNGVLIEGLAPGREYVAKVDCSIRTSGTATRGYWTSFIALGEDEFAGPYANPDVVTTSNFSTHSSTAATVVANSAGEIRFWPAVRWTSGTVSGNRSNICITLY